MKFLFIILFSVSAACAQDKEWQEIKSVLDAQSEAWNRGNIEDYMQGYWKSPELKFIGSKGLTKGWQETLDNYKKSYPDKDAMGTLSFNVISHEPLGKEYYQVIGKWHLQRISDELQGHFTLLWKKINGSWVIISDHSS
jgi:hypothetical protein